MTTIASNLYASKAFSEHPIALWTIDDDVSFLSLINDNDRDFSNWAEFDNASAVSASSIPGAPFEESVFSTFTIINASAMGEAISNDFFNLSDLNKDQDNFSISFFINTNCTDVDFYEFGYRYFDDFLGEFVEQVSRSFDRRFNTWIRMSATFNPPDRNSDVQMIFRVYANDGSIDYDFTMNGLSIGQWSENTSYLSLGAVSSSTPIGYDGVPAFEYGIQESSGYYIVESGRLLAINEGIPMVYGSENSTKIIPSASANPSIVFPGYGFLHESGKNKNYTFEFWARLDPDTIESRRIFGPIDTDNGLYVRDGVLTLVLGDYIGSHPVSEWYRPMLIHIVLRDDTASLMVNGEKVFDIEYDVNNIVFAIENDWVGFYSYEDISNFQIDSVSIYSYPMAAPVAKRRFVWGQGTDSPQNISDAFDGTNAYINFSNAKYTVNKTYPDTNLWSAGYSDNLATTRGSISSPNYSLPEIFISGRNLFDLYLDNKTVNELEGDEFFTFRPHVSASTYTSEGIKWNEPSYLLFDSLSIVDRLSSIYAVFSVKNSVPYQPLLNFKNTDNEDTLSIYLESGIIYYDFNDETLTTQEVNQVFDNYEYFYDYQYGYGPFPTYEYPFAVGLNIKDFAKSFGYRISQFFKSINNVQMYVGGNGVETFTGKIHSVGLSNRKNTTEIYDKFLSNGTVDCLEYQDLLNHYSTYTLVPVIRFNRFFLDISISSEWEEYFPLSSFAGYATDFDGKQYYDIDYLQLNLGYPAVTELVAEVIQNLGWTYEELKDRYSVPIQKTYENLDNAIITGYQNYNDLKNNNIVEYFLNTEKSSLRSYITFQTLFDGANKPLSDFIYSKDVISCCFIDAAEENTTTEPYRAYQTKFEFVDNVVVYPPKNIDFNEVAMVVHFDIKQKGILSNPVRVRDFEIASRALNENSVNPIATESGTPLYPYVKTGIYLDYKQKNPIRISKRRYPYLHLTDTSGVKILGPQATDKEYGIAMPVNQSRKLSFSVGSIQLWMKYEFNQFSVVPTPIFEVDSRNRNIEFVVTADSSGKRGIISARDKNTKIIEERLTFYQNGIPVKNPFIEINEWNSVGVEFDDPLNYNNYIGYINLFRGVTYNNISYYDSAGLGERTATSPRIWLRVLTEDGLGNFTWAYWLTDSITSEMTTWRNVAVIDEKTVFDLTQQDIYKAFAGTNRIIVDDGTSLSIDSDQLTVISEASWTRFSGKPA